MFPGSNFTPIVLTVLSCMFGFAAIHNTLLAHSLLLTGNVRSSLSCIVLRTIIIVATGPSCHCAFHASDLTR